MLELPVPKLGSCNGHASLNLRSQILFDTRELEPSDDPLTQGIGWHSQRVHENGHWIRYHGSTIGVLLTLLRDARDRTANGIYQEMDAENRRHLADLRHNGRALFRFATHAEDLNVLGADLALWSEIWLDLYYAYHALFDSTAVYPVRWHPSDAINAALADNWLHLSAAGRGLPYPGHDLARRCMAETPTFRSAWSRPLTTRSLLECASSLDELYVMLHPVIRQNTAGLFEMVEATLMHTDYGVPFRVAHKVSSRVLSPSTILALIDFALNPPIPGVSPNAGQLTWSELYPPARFERALALRDMEFDLPPFPSCEDLIDFRAELVRATGFRYGQIAQPLSDSPSLMAVLGQLSQWQCDLREVMLYVATKFLPLRESDPALISHFGSATYGKEAIRLIDYADWNDVLMPFVEVNSRGLAFAAHVGRAEATAYVYKVAAEGTTDDIVNGVGPLTVDHLPTDFGPERLGDLSEFVRRVYGMRM